MDDITAGVAPSDRPDSKTARYDRQLRLWASSGQAALENAHILVVNAGATSTSILKNLVLPGIGEFTILDDALVTQADLGNNFFLDPSSLGKPRAEEAAQFLCEMNDAVRSHALVENLHRFLNKDDALQPYSIVICVNAPPQETMTLGDACWNRGIPMIVVKTSGYFGWVRNQVKDLPFVETHPEAEATLDLRLDSPWPELLQYAHQVDMQALDSHEYNHIPAVVILIRAIEDWKAAHGGEIPKNHKEKKQLQANIDAMKRNGKDADVENFDEAKSWVMKACKKTEIPAEIQQILNDSVYAKLPEAKTMTSFPLLVQALKAFVASPNNPMHQLPLTGALPDMKATSVGYASLRAIYRKKAAADFEHFKQLLHQATSSASVNADTISDDEIKSFIKNAKHMKVARTRSVREEIEKTNKSLLQQTIQDEDSLIHFYVAFTAADNFYLEHERYPGEMPIEKDPNGDVDTECFAGSAHKLLQRWDVDEGRVSEATGKALHEITRSAGSDLPQTAALMGGIVAQEAIKLITQQYFPSLGTVIWDGIKSRCEEFKL